MKADTESKWSPLQVYHPLPWLHAHLFLPPPVRTSGAKEASMLLSGIRTVDRDRQEKRIASIRPASQWKSIPWTKVPAQAFYSECLCSTSIYSLGPRLEGTYIKVICLWLQSTISIHSRTITSQWHLMPSIRLQQQRMKRHLRGKVPMLLIHLLQILFPLPG